jgi:arylsulfatase A-like enzyme
LGGGGHQLPASLDRAGGPTSFVASAGAGARPLNVVIVMLESVRASATSVYAPALHTTPYLAELANSSLVVDQMYAVIPRTSAAWVAILQGLVPSTNSALMTWAIRQATASDSPSLPRLLRPHGYRSAFFVPTHLNYENEGQIIRNMGFDQVVSLDHFKGVQRVNYFGVEDRHLLGPVMDWVDQADRDHQPFVLSIMTNVGHHKYDVPQTWPHRTYSPSSDPDFNNYLNCVAYIDNFLRELMAGLATRRVLDSSVVLIVGDHGEAFGEHGARQHAMSLYEESLHVPMLIHAPRLYPRGGRVGGVRQQIDIVPTVAELLGLQMTGARLPGSSLLQPVPADRRLYFSSILEDVALGLRVGSHKYIYNFGRTPTEAYELDSDPAERHDKANTLSAAGRRAIESDLQDWYERGRQAMVH